MPKLLGLRAFALSAVLFASPASAWECVALFGIPCPPPPQCDYEPKKGAYVVNHVRDANASCRQWFAHWEARGVPMPKSPPWSPFMGCTIWQPRGKPHIVFLPRPEIVGQSHYAAVRRHELGHVNCPD